MSELAPLTESPHISSSLSEVPLLTWNPYTHSELICMYARTHARTQTACWSGQHIASPRCLSFSSFVSSGAVLSLAMTSSGEQCFSGGLDSTIQWWNIPSSNVDPYDTYGMQTCCATNIKVFHKMFQNKLQNVRNVPESVVASKRGRFGFYVPPKYRTTAQAMFAPSSTSCLLLSVLLFQTDTLCLLQTSLTHPPECSVQSDPSVLAGSWTGHTDAVWGLAYSGIKNRLLSCSADGTVRLWNPTEKNPCISTFNTNRGENIEATKRTTAEPSLQLHCHNTSWQCGFCPSLLVLICVEIIYTLCFLLLLVYIVNNTGD